MAYFDRIWEGVPEGAAPERFDLRRDFLLAGVRPGERVLDVGCGEGAFSAALARAGAHPIGVEVAAEPLRRAHRRHPELELHLLGGSLPAGSAGRTRWPADAFPGHSVAEARFAGAGRFPFPDAFFDAVWAGEVIEHVLDGLGLLDELRRLLRPGGRLLVSTPDHPRRLAWALALRRRAFERHFDPRSDHVRFFTRRTLALLLEDAGFSAAGIERRRGVLLARAVR